MNAFQILNEDGSPIPLNELDKIAAKYWEVELDPQHYAKPSSRLRFENNWYDIIGFAISQQGYHLKESWQNVVLYLLEDISSMFVDSTSGYSERPVTINPIESIKDNINQTIEYYRPYIDLINHFQGLGYKPKKVINN